MLKEWNKLKERMKKIEKESKRKVKVKEGE
jgi:hypothetical protein